MTDRPWTATYRLQLSPQFTFEDATRALPYLKRLGISHIYLSPIWAAVSGSDHGYDVTDHARVNEALGGLSGLLEFGRAARANGLGIILDIVPNHVGIATHPWWRDVLRFGPASHFAPYFDIDWEGQPQQQSGVLVYPVLGQPFGRALESGEFSLGYDGREVVVQYFDRSFPVSPGQYLRVLGLPPETLSIEESRAAVSVLEGLSTAAPDAAMALLERLAELANNSAAVREWLDRRLAEYSGRPGDPGSFDALDTLLQAQHYRLAYWRVSAEEINYRRFFDINELAAIRVEHEPTFVETHELIGQLIAGAMVDGLRIDHIDGLYDPSSYLNRLRELASANGAEAGFGIWVEKILARGEELPAHWPVEGTTGYDFLAVAGGLLVDSSSTQAFTAIYEDFVGVRLDFEDVAFAARRRISGRAFAGEVNVLALQLYRLAQARRAARDLTLGALRDAIASLLAALPIYRTYLENDEPMPRDRDLILSASSDAMERDANISEEAMGFLVQVMLLEAEANRDGERGRWVHFRRRFQQLSGPVMAKGVEDTAFFRYHRLLACNEVGDDPGHYGTRSDEAHAAFAARGRMWPLSMNATTTHDTKRSEDARMRLAALSGVPRAWHREVRAWARMNRRYLQSTEDGPIPEPNVEYYIYQTLVASWSGQPGAGYRARIVEHMVKAMREAKLATSWTRVDPEYESAVLGFVEAILDRRKSRAFVQRADLFVRAIEPAARLNSLALVTLKCTAPGIPDFFQGSEFPVLTLTDPDNRRPVDFEVAAREGEAAELEGHDPGVPATKPWLTRRLLALRRDFPSLLSEGGYWPADVDGPASERVFAFLREHEGEQLAVVVPLNPAQFMDGEGRFTPETLSDTFIALPAGRWEHWLTGENHSGATALSRLLADFPIAVLINRGAKAP